MKTEKMSFCIEELCKSSRAPTNQTEAVIYKIHQPYQNPHPPTTIPEASMYTNTPSPSFMKRRRYDSLSDDSMSPTDYSDDQDADQPRKRHRTMYTNAQVIELERYYSVRKYLAVEDRPIIAKKLKLSQTQIKWWFQNRRMKEKRQMRYTSPPQRDNDMSGFVGVGKPAPRTLPTQSLPPVYYPYSTGSTVLLPGYSY